MSGRATREGWVAEELREELPGLGLVSLTLPAPPLGRSPRSVRDHLASLASRFRGADALALRQRPVPHAYRVCFRHVGLDPDATRVPAEAAAVDRLLHGGFASRGLLDDALTIALVETGVPLWALDAGAVEEPLGLRLSAAGRIVVADARAELGPLFGELAPAYAVAKRTTTLLLFAVRVPGVAAMQLEEALWLCVETLRAR